MENLTSVAEPRRKFLKKAAYVAPVIVGLGGLTLPVSAGASVFTTKLTYYNSSGNAFDAEALIYGNSATGKLFDPAGGVIKYNQGTTIYKLDIKIEDVIKNQNGYFNFGRDWFDEIIYNEPNHSTAKIEIDPNEVK